LVSIVGDLRCYACAEGWNLIMKEIMIKIIIIFLFIMTGFFIYEKVNNHKLGQEIKEAQEIIAELEEQSSQLDGRIKQLVILNQDLDSKYQALEKQKQELNQKLKETEVKLAEISGQVEAMTPDELVQTTRSILKNNGVDKIDSGARFSMAAFKKNTTILLQWQEYITEKIPLLEEKANIQEKEILNLQNQVFLWEETDRLWRQKNTIWAEEKATLNSLLIDYQKMINSEKRKKLYSSVVGGLVGLGLGILIGK